LDWINYIIDNPLESAFGLTVVVLMVYNLRVIGAATRWLFLSRHSTFNQLLHDNRLSYLNYQIGALVIALVVILFKNVIEPWWMGAL